MKVDFTLAGQPGDWDAAVSAALPSAGRLLEPDQNRLQAAAWLPLREAAG